VRFGLTSESSLNDGLAFPFTNLAILLAVYGFAPSEWAVRWLLIDVGYKIVGGVVIGWAVGEVLGWLTLKLVGGKGFAGMFDTGEGLAPSVMALAYTLISFGLCEVAGAYGFIAVFVTAYVVRDSERQNHVHDHLHEGAEQLELLAMSIVLLLLGAAFADGLYQAVTWEMVAAALLLVLVARPVAGWIGLLGHGGATHPERLLLSFFGIRGLGSIYYLAYGLNRAEFIQAEAMWALFCVTIFASLLIHGLTARPAVAWLERQRDAEAAPDRPTDTKARKLPGGDGPDNV